jgi:hypothetical protein
MSNKHTCNNVKLFATVSSPGWILWVDNAVINSWELQPISMAALVTAAKRMR